MGKSLSKEWKFEGSIYCTGAGCEEFPQCGGAINMAVREWGCEIELHGTITEVAETEERKGHTVRRTIPVV